jgi:hypothetical protein
VHFTPTSASWLNQVERFFAEITEKRIRRGAFHNVKALEQVIRNYLEDHNQDPKPFIWTATAELILSRVKEADLHERIRTIEQGCQAALQRGLVEETEAARALGEFTPVWEALTPREQARVTELLIERVDYVGGRKKVSITFHPTGIKTLASEFGERKEKIA